MRTECLVLSEQDRVESRLTTHESRIAMGDPEDDDEEEEEERKKRDEDKDEEDGDGEDEEEPWKVNSWTRISIPGRTTLGLCRDPRVTTHLEIWPPRCGKMLAPVRIGQACGRDLLAARRCVYEAVVADIDRDVRVALAFLVEEQQIARADFLPGDSAGVCPQSFRGARQVHADAGVAVVHQSAAVETLRRVAAHSIRLALHAERVPRGAGADADVRLGLPRRGRAAAKGEQDQTDGNR